MINMSENVFLKNGKPYHRIEETCQNCGGTGIFCTHTLNGVGVPARPDDGRCYRCQGTGKIVVERRVLTEKEKAQRERAKARREEKTRAEREARQAKYLEMQAKRAQWQKEKEERIAAIKAVSQYQGTIGQKITVQAIFKKYFYFESQFGRQYIYLFEDESKNVYKWTTSTSIPQQEGATVKLTGTVKDHTEYNDQKQTVLTRCKVED